MTTYSKSMLCKNIRKIRLEKGLSQEELAAKTGYASNSMIAQIENGIIDLPYSKIILFADALDVSIPVLMGYPDIDSIRSIYESLPAYWQTYMQLQLKFATIQADEEKENGDMFFLKYQNS